MDKKTIKIKTQDSEEIIAKYTRFGWEIVDQQEEGEKTIVNFTRDPSIPNYKNVKKMEKQYWQLKQKFPYGLVIWFVLGTACLVVRLTTSFPYNDLLWFGMALFYCLAAYHLFLFITISCNRRKLIDALKEYSQTTLGLRADLPYLVNVETKNEYTGLIEQNYERKTQK